MRLQIVHPALFAKKTVSVFVLAFALLPLVTLKQDLPALLYAGALVLLHAFVLVAYLYRVRFRELDADWRSLVARLLALAVVMYLLSAASRFSPDEGLGTLGAQMLAISVLHTAVLVLLMARVVPASGAPAAEAPRTEVGRAETVERASAKR